MKKIVFLTPPSAEFGFSLAGIPQVTAQPADAEAALIKTMEDAGNGLVVVDERLVSADHESKGLSEERLRDLEHDWPGILLILPSPQKPPPEAEDYAARLIRRAVGYHVRLKL